MRVEALIPLHPFVEIILDFFNLVPFQLTLNSLYIILAFYIMHMEAGLGAPSGRRVHLYLLHQGTR